MFIFFARPKKTNQKKRRLNQGIFSTNRSKNCIRNSASSLIGTPDLGDFVYYSAVKDFWLHRFSFYIIIHNYIIYNYLGFYYAP